MTAKELLEMAKQGYESIDYSKMAREDVRCIHWLIETGKVDTITLDELQAEIDKNAGYRATRL